MKIRDALVVGVLLSALFFSEVIIERFGGDESREQDKPEAVREYYFNDAVLIASSSDGTPAYRLRAVKIRSPIDSDEVDLEDVTLHMGEDPDNSWSLRADHGHVYSLGEQVEFRGNVVLEQNSAADDALKISTERLEYNPGDAIASTDAPVDIETFGRRLSAQGMTAYLLEGRLELQSEVHGRFTP